MGIVSILSLLLPLLSNILAGSGVIPSGLAGLATTSAQAIATLIAALTGGKTTIESATLAALQAVQTEITALKNSNVLVTLNQANLINALAQAISDAIAAYEKSLVTTDPSTVHPLPTNL